MDSINKIDKKLAEARASLKKLNAEKKRLIRLATTGRLAAAKKKAKYKIGDILEYAHENPPILVTGIGCYEDGDPWYEGLQILNGKLTRNRRRTEGWGKQSATTDRDGRAFQSTWRKVGDCSMLRLCQNPEVRDGGLPPFSGPTG